MFVVAAAHTYRCPKIDALSHKVQANYFEFIEFVSIECAFRVEQFVCALARVSSAP